MWRLQDSEAAPAAILHRRHPEVVQSSLSLPLPCMICPPNQPLAGVALSIFSRPSSPKKDKARANAFPIERSSHAMAWTTT